MRTLAIALTLALLAGTATAQTITCTTFGGISTCFGGGQTATCVRIGNMISCS